MGLSRITNMLHCGVDYLFNRVGSHLPVFIAIEPANFCMLRCPQCPVGVAEKKTNREFFDETLFDTILTETGSTLQTIIFHFQGEPLLHPNLPAFITKAHDKGVYTMLSTNAQTLTKEYAHQLVASGLSKIVVSIDGFTQKTYEQYRVGGSLERALKALEFLVEAKYALRANIIIEWQCLALRSNENEWDMMRRKAKQLGVKFVLKTAQFYDFENGNPLMPTDERYSRYQKQADGTYRLKRKLHNRCFRLWSGCVIDTQGNMLPCCYDKHKQYVYGNLNDNSFRECWFSEKAVSLRKKILSSRSTVGICRNCDE